MEDLPVFNPLWLGNIEGLRVVLLGLGPDAG
jgi:hypothetical protein